jgi:hypothetical protein
MCVVKKKIRDLTTLVQIATTRGVTSEALGVVATPSIANCTSHIENRKIHRNHNKTHN